MIELAQAIELLELALILLVLYGAYRWGVSIQGDSDQHDKPRGGPRNPWSR